MQKGTLVSADNLTEHFTILCQWINDCLNYHPDNITHLIFDVGPIRELPSPNIHLNHRLGGKTRVEVVFDIKKKMVDVKHWTTNYSDHEQIKGLEICLEEMKISCFGYDKPKLKFLLTDENKQTENFLTNIHIFIENTFEFLKEY